MSKTHFADRDYVIKFVSRALREGRLAIFLGSGISFELFNKGAGAIGLPSWPELIRRLYVSQRLSVPRGDNYVQHAEDFKNAVIEKGKTTKEFHRLVKDALYAKVDLKFVEISKNRTLSAIGALVAHSQRGSIREVFTFNFDDILERYLQYYGIIAKPVIGERFWAVVADVLVHHPHGFLPSPGSPFVDPSSFLVFDERSYLDRRSDDRWDQRIEVAMQANVCLFVGLGRNDSHLKQLVQRTSTKHAFSAAKDGYWGVVLRAQPKVEEKRDWNQYQIHVEPLADYKEDLAEFLFSVCQRAGTTT